MKILVTGGTGFIGSHLVTELLREKHEVDVLSNIVQSNKKGHIFADITDRAAMLQIIPQYDLVFHLAGLLGTSELLDQAYEASRVNILGAINIFDGALVNKTKVVYITKPNCWLNTYSITKYAGESFAKMYYQEFGLPTVSICWYNVYGPNQSFHCQKAVPFFIRWALNNEPVQIWGDGEQTMDLIYATDAVKATIELSKHSELEGQTIDVGTGIATSVNELAEKIIKHTESKSSIEHLPMRPGEMPNTRLVADIACLEKIGFTSKVSLQDGLQETIAWYRDNLE